MSGNSPDWDKLRKLVRERHGYIGSDMDILMPLIDAVEDMQTRLSTTNDPQTTPVPSAPETNGSPRPAAKRGGRPFGSKNKK
jgi:hypothetical protein